jgi:hypothetical protein
MGSIRPLAKCHVPTFERGTAIVRRAMELNANHAGWMHFAPLWNHFQKGEYEQALECANRVDFPGFFWPYLVMASTCGHLGRRTEAASALQDLLALDPEFAAHARSNVGTWHFASGLMDSILDGLRKAGLAIPESGSSDSPKPNGTIAGKTEQAKSGTDARVIRRRPTIRERSAAEIFANLKEITLPSQFRKKVKELYVGRWTREPGWQVTVFSLPSKLSGRRWLCSFKEAGSDILVMASTAQDVSKLRPGDSVTVNGRISDVWQALPLVLEDAMLQGENVPFP